MKLILKQAFGLGLSASPGRLAPCTCIPHVSQLQSLRGMVDLLPEAQRWQAVEAMARDHFQRSGCGEIRTPLLRRPICSAAESATPMWWAEMYSFRIG